MEEPLCTYNSYEVYKCICEEFSKSKPPYEGVIKSLQEMISQYDPVFRDTWRFVLRFLSLIADVNTKVLFLINDYDLIALSSYDFYCFLGYSIQAYRIPLGRHGYLEAFHRPFDINDN